MFKHKKTIDFYVLFIGFIVFIGVYALGGILVILSLSLLPEDINSDSAMWFLRIGGYLALAFPAYVTARAVDAHVMLHALIMGVIEAIGVVLLMMNTFSFDGSLKDYVISQMIPVFMGIILLALIAGYVAQKINNKEQLTSG